MTESDDGKRTGIVLEIHAPERRRRPVVLAGGCCTSCCCCCCCLHVIGGLVGAGLAGDSGVKLARLSLPGMSPSPTLDAKSRPESPVDAVRRVQRIYWGALGLTIVLVALISVWLGGPFATMVILLLGLPVLQLAASVIASIRVAALAGPHHRRAQGEVVRITAYGLLGAAIGGALLVPLYLLLQ